MGKYELIEHTADVGIRSFGATEREAFENAAAGMFSLMTDLNRVHTDLEFPVEVEAEDRETLLVEWLNELLYIAESNNVLLAGFEISELSENRLKGTAFGETIDPQRHELRDEIKAVTYHMLKVEKQREGWKAEVLFDV